MSHEHNHAHDVKGKNLFITILLNIVITLAQIIGGILSGSLALLSDALHNFSDVIALVIAWWANKLSVKENSIDKTFGYKRAEILATLFNASALAGIGIYLIFESIERFVHPQIISSSIVIYLALLGVVFNAFSVFLIKDDIHDNMNIKAAYLHLLTDVMTSVAVLVGGVAMLFFEIYWIDSVVTILIAFYLIKSSISLIKESGGILMQFSPKEIDIVQIQEMILQHSEIKNIHHVHAWKLNDKEIIFEAHLDFEKDLLLSDVTKIITLIEINLQEHFDIKHITLQNEFQKNDTKDLIYNRGKQK